MSFSSTNSKDQEQEFDSLYTEKSLHDSIHLLVRAIKFASEKHQFQKRKREHPIPYINHPIATVEILTECGVVNRNVLAAAALHDTLEDTNTSKEELEREFGKEITSIVQEVTDDKKLDKVTRKKLQLEHARTISKEAKLVKLADKYSNCMDPPPSIWSKEEYEGYNIWSYAIFLQAKGINSLLDSKLENLFHSSLGISKEITQTQVEEKLSNYYFLLETKYSNS